MIMDKARLKGVTLLELMVTLVIIAILTTMALPRLSDIFYEINSESLQQALLSSLTLARSESIKSGNLTALCPSSDGSTCINTVDNWSQGWLIFTDNNSNGSFDSGSDTILYYNSVDAAININWTNTLTTAANATIVFEGDGTVTDTSTGIFDICDRNGIILNAKSVRLNLSGRARAIDTENCQ